jgi:hypothetical protein
MKSLNRLHRASRAGTVTCFLFFAIAQTSLAVQTEFTKLMEGEAGDKFGFSVALERNRLVVGAPSHYSNNQAPGKVFVFERELSDNWVEKDQLFASDGLLGDEFGHAIALEGDLLVIGAPFVENAKGEFVGAAYVFTKSTDGFWQETARLRPEEEVSFCGMSVDLSGDTAVISGGGLAHLFDRATNGEWSLSAVLTGPHVEKVEVHENDVILAGSFDSQTVGASIFQRQPGGQWAHMQDVAVNHQDLITSVSLSLDEDLFVISMIAFIGDPRVLVYRRDPQGIWSFETDLITKSGDLFGRGVKVSHGIALIGSPYDDFEGAAYAFMRSPSGHWRLIERLIPSDGGGIFGGSVDVEDGLPVVGDWSDSERGNFAGAVYIFPRLPEVRGAEGMQTLR